MSTAPRSRRRTLAVRITLGLALAATVFAWIWKVYGAAPQVTLDDFTIERRPDGTWTELPAPAQESALRIGLGQEVVAGTQHPLWFRPRTLRDARYFDCRDLLLVGDGDEPLTAAVVHRLARRLQEVPELERIRFASDVGKTNDVLVADAAPTSVIHVRRVEGHELADSFFALDVTFSDLFDRPVQRFPTFRRVIPTTAFAHRWHAGTYLESRGLTTRAAHFEAVADALSEALADEILATFSDLREAHDVIGPVPEVLHASHRPVDAALTLDDMEGMQRLASWPGLFLHNETWWRGAIEGTDEEVMARIADSLASSGYASKRSRPTWQIHLKGRKEVLVHLDELSWPLGAAAIEPPVFDPERSRTPTRTRLVVRYREHAAPETVETMLAAAADGSGDAALIAAFRNEWEEWQQREQEQWIEPVADDDPEVLVERARALADSDPAAAERDLHVAWWLARTLPDVHYAGLQFKQTESVEGVAETLDLDLRTSPDPDVLLEAGFARLPPVPDAVGPGGARAELAHEELVRLFVPRPESAPVVFTVGLTERGIELRAFGGDDVTGVGARGAREMHVSTGAVTLWLNVLEGPRDGRATVMLRATHDG